MVILSLSPRISSSYSPSTTIRPKIKQTSGILKHCAQMTLFRIRATICPLVIKPIYIFIFFLLSNCSLCVDPHFEACSVPKSCGEIHNISYPFYIEGLQEPYCGYPYPGFKLVCDNNHAILKLPDNYNDYFVQEISYPSQTLRVLNRNISVLALDSNISCSPPFQNLTLEREEGFELGSGVADLFLYFNCPDSALEERKSNKIVCSNGGTKHTGYGLALLGGDTNLRCGQLVRVPVERSAAESGNWSDYVNMMKRGFLLKWAASDCSTCKDSGGKCGFNDTILHFSCFCPDRPHKVRCKEGKKELKLEVAIPGSVFVLGIASLLMFIAYRRHKRQKLESANFLSRNISSDPSSKSNLERGGVYFGIPIFSYNDLVIATNNFDPSKELGDGGFGTVYYGKLRDGREVAVKRLYENNYKRVEQFMNEIEILTRLRHRNLVSLYGCTSRTSRELILVYEYIANGTVADHLHGDRANPSALTWPLRMNIAIEIANALVYLHASDIIHRDVKTNNVLLDDNFHVKVADFGLSRLFPVDVTHVSTAPQGTPGYVDPEYHQYYQLTEKSDVYSFGVVLIELISSMPAIDISRHKHEINLFNYAINKIQNHAINELVDPVLGFQTDFKVRRMTTLVAELAFRCLQSDKEMRPSMDEVLKHLIRIETEEEYEVDTNGEELKDLRSSESDEVVLLKHNQLQPSPESMMEKWNGRSTSLKHNQPPPSPESVIDKWNSRSTISSDSC